MERVNLITHLLFDGMNAGRGHTSVAFKWSCLSHTWISILANWITSPKWARTYPSTWPRPRVQDEEKVSIQWFNSQFPFIRTWLFHSVIDWRIWKFLFFAHSLSSEMERKLNLFRSFLDFQIFLFNNLFSAELNEEEEDSSSLFFSLSLYLFESRYKASWVLNWDHMLIAIRKFRFRDFKVNVRLAIGRNILTHTWSGTSSNSNTKLCSYLFRIILFVNE